MEADPKLGGARVKGRRNSTPAPRAALLRVTKAGLEGLRLPIRLEQSGL